MTLNNSTISKNNLSYFYVFGIKIIGILSLVLAFILLNRLFGEIEFGVFSFVFILIQIGNMFAGFGIPFYLLKYYPRLEDLERKSLVNESLNAFILSTSLSVIIFPLILLLFLYNQTITINWIIVGSLAIPLMGISDYCSRLLRAADKQILAELTAFNTFNFCLFLFSSLFYFLDYNKIGLEIFVVLSATFQALLSLKFAYPLINIKRFNLVESINWILKAESYEFLMTKIGQQGISWVTVLVSGLLLEISDSGGFNVMIKLSGLTAVIIGVTNSFFTPRYSTLLGQKKILKLNELIKPAVRLTSFLGLPILIVFTFFPSQILSLFNESYHVYSDAFKIIIIGALVNLICGPVGLLMQLTDNYKVFRNLMLLAVLLHFILSWILSNYFQIMGMAVSLSVVTLFWNISSIFVLYKKEGLKAYLH